MIKAEADSVPHPRLTRFPLGGLRELSFLALPLIFSFLSSSLLGLCDRFFLSRYSLDAWNAASAAGHVAYFFQIICIITVTISQVFIGKNIAANKSHEVGPIVWQMIWFSFLSMLLTYPGCFLAERYFYHTEIESYSLVYFRCLASANFLYPLGTALSSFFLGQGKTRIIFLSTLFIQVLNAFLDYLFIFGFEPLFPPLGVFGAALATVLSQGTFCAILFLKFSEGHYVPTFRTDWYQLKLKLLGKMLSSGIPRALGRISITGAWVLASRLLIEKGGDFLTVHTFGTSLILIFTFMNEGLTQATMVATSHILGAKNAEAFNRLARSYMSFLMIIMLVSAIPLLIFNQQLISLFFPQPLPNNLLNLLKMTCFWVWLSILAGGINRMGVSFITASCDTLFYAYTIQPAWMILYAAVYIGIGSLGWSPDKFFLIDVLNTTLLGLIYITRFRQKGYKRDLIPSSSGCTNF